ncbi:MAG: beta-propeller fold lactonase family protein [Gallintestinimicrobium sp.]
MYKIDQKTGLLTKLFCLPISGEYPKDAMLFPDNRHLVSLNHESNTMTFFTVHPDTGLIVMNGPEIKVDWISPNCVVLQTGRRIESENSPSPKAGGEFLWVHLKRVDRKEKSWRCSGCRASAKKKSAYFV